MPKLTPQQAAFTREFLKDFNGTQSAIRAGYSPKTARQQAARLLTKAAIQEQLAEHEEAATTSAVLGLRELQEWWTNAVLGRHPDATYRDQLKASEYLGKSQGMFTEKIESSGDVRIRIIREAP